MRSFLIFYITQHIKIAANIKKDLQLLGVHLSNYLKETETISQNDRHIYIPNNKLFCDYDRNKKNNLLDKPQYSLLRILFWIINSL